MFLSPASCFSRRPAQPPPTWRGSSTSSCRPRSAAAAAAAPRSGDTARLTMGTSGMFSFHTSLRHYILFRHWRFYSLVTKGKFARKRHSSCLLPPKAWKLLQTWKLLFGPLDLRFEIGNWTLMLRSENIGKQTKCYFNASADGGSDTIHCPNEVVMAKESRI